MRGLFLALMIVDHIGGLLSKHLTWQPLGWVSAAEGFVFLSGCVFAYVHRRRLDDPEALCIASWKRAWQVYYWYLGIVALVVLLPSPGQWLADGFGRGDWQPQLPSFWQHVDHWWGWRSLAASALLYRSGNILPLYVWFLLLAPPLLLLLRVRRLVPAILIASLALWAIGLRVDLQTLTINALLGSSYRANLFPLLSWQIFFVLGLWAGSRWGQGILPSWLRGATATVLLALLAGFYFAWRHVLSYPLFEALGGDWVWESWTREVAHPMRLLNFLVLAVLIKRAWEPVPSECGVGWLAVMGRHSLAIFAIQAALSVWYLPWQPRFEASAWPLQVVVPVAVLAAFVVLARWLDRRKRPKSTTMLGPAPDGRAGADRPA